MKREPRTVLVTVDVNSRFKVAWGTPTTKPVVDVDVAEASENLAHGDGHRRRVTDTLDQCSTVNVSDVIVKDDGKTLLTFYGEGKKRRMITTSGMTMRTLLTAGVRELLPPKFFIRSRTGGRIAVLRDGVEVNVLSILGKAKGIDDPSWKTTNCWNEDEDEVVSVKEAPIGGSVEYSRTYYARTADKRRAQAKSSRKQVAKEVSVEDALAELRRLAGGGGPQ